MQPDSSQPFVVPPNSGRVLRLISVTHRLISQQTGGGYYFFEQEAAASGVYAPLSEMLAAPFKATVIRQLP